MQLPRIGIYFQWCPGLNPTDNFFFCQPLAFFCTCYEKKNKNSSSRNVIHLCNNSDRRKEELGCNSIVKRLHELVKRRNALQKISSHPNVHLFPCKKRGYFFSRTPKSSSNKFLQPFRAPSGQPPQKRCISGKPITGWKSHAVRKKRTGALLAAPPCFCGGEGKCKKEEL